jgi:transcriptional regulator with XRE-family HTH domain
MNEFNMQKIGQRIAEKRRELNMTQSNLADQLLVSYQAISNWERGNSLPDIEKLPQLATSLQLSIDELLGTSSSAVTHYQEGIADAKEITTLAPMIKPKDLAAATQEQSFDIELLQQLAPFLSSEQLFALLESSEEPITEDAFEDFLPFLQPRQLEQLLKDNYSLSFLEEAAPFLAPAFLAEKATQAVEQTGSLEELEDIAPFLESAALGQIIFKSIQTAEQPEQLLDEVEDLLPFLDEETLLSLVASFPFTTEVFELFAPFLSSERILQAFRK